MNNKDVLKEIEGFENKSDFSNKKTIFLCRIMKFLNNEKSYFLLSLVSALSSCYFFDVSLLFGLICHFIFWVTLRKSFIDNDKTKRENEGFDLIITTIRTHLNNKK